LELWVADGTRGVGAREEKGKVVLEAGRATRREG
jgi:hypothetical protein